MRSLPLLLLLAVAGCGGEELTLDNFHPRFAQAYCDALVSCGVIDEHDRSTCERSLTEFPPPTITPLPGTVAAGRLRFDATAAHDCIAQVAAYACRAGTYALPAPCSAVFTPGVAPGGACQNDTECPTGYACVSNGSCGTCQPAPQAGDGCSFTCGPHLRCAAPPASTAGSFSCARLLGAGEPCVSSDVKVCDDGLVCIASADYSQGTCQPPAGPGQPCAPFFVESDFSLDLSRFDGTCRNGLVCDYSLAQPVCTPPKKLGEPCGAWLSCEGGLHCSTIAPGIKISAHVLSLAPIQGTCVGWQPLGAVCDPSHPCQGYQYCDGDTAVCTRKPVLGESCTFHGTACAVGICADVCEPWLKAGEACDPEGNRCGLFLDCDAQTRKCTAPATSCP